MDTPAPTDLATLDERLSAPGPEAVAALAACDGDVVILGAGGKMGPSLARMARRAMDVADGGRRRQVIAVSRWSDARAAQTLTDAGVVVLQADLLDRAAVDALPAAPNVIFMAGQKFGTGGDPAQTWAMNTVVPAWCGWKYAESRQVVFSTGNVYPLTPRGEYAMSCLGRERVMSALAVTRQSSVALYRLNYACALTYGVLTDLAVKVRDRVPIDLTMGAVNVIWQGDANTIAIALLSHAERAPVPVNVTGLETLAVRDLATRLGTLLGKAPVFTGAEAPDALLSNASGLTARFGAGLSLLPLDTLLAWTADWVRHDRPLLGKATKFEVRDGTF